MATVFSVLAKLRGDASAMVSEFRGGFAKVKREGTKAADSIARRFSRRVGRAARAGLTAAGGGIVAAAGVGLKEALDFNAILSDIEIQSGLSAEGMAKFQAALEEVSAKTTISRVDLAATGKVLVDLLGPAGASAEILDLVARAAIASGAEAKDLAGLISALKDSFDIDLTDIDALEESLSGALAAGKAGKIPLQEMSTVLQEVSSDFAKVSTGGPAAMALLVSAMQTARTAFGSTAQAGTGLKSGITALITRAAELKKLKIDVFVGKGQELRLAEFTTIIDKLSKLNIQQLTDALGSSEAAKFFFAFRDEGRKSFDAIEDAAVGATDIVDDFGKRTETQGFKIAKSMNDVKLAVSDAFQPERIQILVDGLSLVAAGAGKAVDALEAIGTFLGETAATIGGGDIEEIEQLIEDEKLFAAARRRGAARKTLGPTGITGDVIAPTLTGEVEEILQARKTIATAGKAGGFETLQAIGQAQDVLDLASERALAAALLVEQGSAKTVPQIEREQEISQAVERLLVPMLALAVSIQEQTASTEDNTRAQQNRGGSDSPRASGAMSGDLGPR